MKPARGSIRIVSDGTAVGTKVYDKEGAVYELGSDAPLVVSGKKEQPDEAH